MRKHLTFIAAAALALAFALPVFAQKPEKADKPKQSPRFTGVVEAVDATAGTVTLKNMKGESKTFACPADCKIKDGGKLADLKTGEKLVVTYKEDGTKLVAQKIAPPPPPAPKEPKKDAPAK